jgi:glycosyltransferase involved in cell wall biosynthesis
MTALKIITNCGACEQYIGRSIDSLRSQTFGGWEAFVTVDPCGDATYERALDAARGDARIHIVRNEQRLWTMENVVRAVARLGDDPEDVFVVVDGDDWLATPRALATVAATYTDNDCWMTYGSWVSSIDPDDGRWGPYPAGTRDFRTAPWRGTHLRTWKRWLWDEIDDRDLRDVDGGYFRIVEDRAYMLPMLEMSTTRRARHIAEVLLTYNRGNPQCVGNVMLDEMRRCTAVVHARPPYRPLPEKNVHNRPAAGVSLVTPANQALRR